MARTEIGLIIDVLVAHEVGITGTYATYDETPESFGMGPAWLNFPMSGELTAQTGWGEDVHTIGCACVKRRSLLPADEATMRPMITRFADAIHADLSLGGRVEHVGAIRYRYGLIGALSSETEPVFGVLFEVDVKVKDVITVGE
jgi:hypothetical protein